MEELLAELEPLLYGHNYQVFLRAYRVTCAAGKSAESLIAQALGPLAVVGGVVPVTQLEVLTEVEQCLRYAGDSGSGPKPMALRSRRFAALVPAVLSELEAALTGASVVTQCWLKDGHPAYPVFWDFAYVIAGPAGGLVFVGSSSD